MLEHIILCTCVKQIVVHEVQIFVDPNCLTLRIVMASEEVW
jgi:hypothetical protein